MKKSGGIIICLVFILIALNACLASAQIEITQPLTVYNFGDSIFLTVTTTPTEITGNFEINLVCNNATTNVYKISPAESAFSPNVEQKINHKIILTKEFIGELSGDCYIITSLGQESATTNKFFLTNLIEVNPTISGTYFNPGEEIKIEINAIKANGIPLNGFIETNGLKEIVKNGKTTIQYRLENNTKAGAYTLELSVYDEEKGIILNEKKESLNYSVNQIASKIQLNIMNTSVMPGSTLEFSTDLLDQTGDKITRDVTAIYTSPKNKANQLNIQSGETGKIFFEKNSTLGEYSLKLSYGGLSDETTFAVNELAEVLITLIDNSSIIIVKNIGNVPYKDNLSINLNGELISVPVSLKLAEQKKYNLQAPNGAYTLEITSGSSVMNGQALLTGNAISLKEATNFAFIEKNLWMVIIFLAILFLLLAIVLIVKNRKTYKLQDRIKPDKKGEEIRVLSAKANMNKQFVDLAKPLVQEAESSLNIKGNKDYCSIVSVKVKNNDLLGAEAKNQLNLIISNAKEKFGVLDLKGSHILIIFSSLMNKTTKNEIIAAQAAFEIKTKLDDYNKRFKDKIDYNLGVNSGDVISSTVGDKFSYTSLGNTVLLAKRISDLSTGKLLVSATFRQKLIRELKVNPFQHALGNIQVYEVTRIANVEANQEKLKDLLKRTSWS